MRISASPRRPNAIAWPLPTAITLTAMPVRRSNGGSTVSSNPASRIEVVVASVTVADVCA